MRVINSRPPAAWEPAYELFGLREDQATFFTHGDTIYNPAGVELDPYLIRHEETHADQQEHSEDVADMWCKRYLQDEDFRIEQEAEAYGAQYALYCQVHKDRNERALYLHTIAGFLSSPMYGSVITIGEAKARIREYAGLEK